MRANFSLGVALFAVVALTTFGGCGKSDGDAAKTTASIPGNGSGGNPADKTAIPQTPPEVVLETNVGLITLRLNKEKSPKTVENFLSYVNEKFYEGTIFHSVHKNQGIIGGGYTADLAVKQAKVPILNEANNGLKNKRYTVAMLREPDVIDSATSVFLINADDNPAFDYKARTAEGYGYCVFGEVIAGKEIVDQISSVEVHDVEGIPSTPKEPVVIKSAKKIK